MAGDGLNGHLSSSEGDGSKERIQDVLKEGSASNFSIVVREGYITLLLQNKCSHDGSDQGKQAADLEIVDGGVIIPNSYFKSLYNIT